MRRMVLILALSACPCGFVKAAFDPCTDLSRSQCDLLQQALIARDAGNFDEASSTFSRLQEESPQSFGPRYENARLLAQTGKYEDALRILDAALVMIDRNSAEPEVLNTTGYVALRSAQYQRALDTFGEILARPDFGSLPVELRVKVHNNTGIAHLMLERYEHAKMQFEQAESLGSALAGRNLEKIESALHVLESGNPDVPGTFATFVGSARGKQEAVALVARLVTLLGAHCGKFSAFESDTRRLLIACASGISYPKAVSLLGKAQDLGIRDAYVASITELREATEDVLGPDVAGSVDK